ncbi:MAG: enoyl-CoA hydratase/isomerase family protein [Candidatus Methylomirabilales bacterium]
MAYEHLHVKTDEGITTITINRPQALNVLTAAAKQELERALLTARDDPAVKVVILTATGEKAFIAGADLREVHPGLKEGAAFAREQFARRGQRLMTLIECLGKPVIAAVNGYALGGGCEIVQACHLAIAAENARFGQPEINIGFNPCWGGTQRLLRQIGRKDAMALILTGEMIDAHEAHRIGLVNKVVPLTELIPETEKLARLLCTKAPNVLQLCLEAVIHGSEMPLADGLEHEAALFAMAVATGDALEGTQAFLEKRKPVFKSRTH